MRCAPQVAGAARDTLAHARSVAGYELASAVDNPVVTAGRPGRVQRQLPRRAGRPTCWTSWPSRPPTCASMTERRTDRMLDVARSRGLPPFLADDPGVDSGHMIAQYTQAALVSELKRLAVPASVDSIPSAAMQEDHVSMGWSAARKLRRVGRRADPGAGDRAADRGPGAGPARAAAAGPGHRGGGRRAARADVPGPARTGSWRRRSRPPSQLVASGGAVRAAESAARPTPLGLTVAVPDGTAVPYGSAGERHGAGTPPARCTDFSNDLADVDVEVPDGNEMTSD